MPKKPLKDSHNTLVFLHIYNGDDVIPGDVLLGVERPLGSSRGHEL